MCCIQSEVLKVYLFCTVFSTAVIFHIKMNKRLFTFTNIDTLFPFYSRTLVYDINLNYSEFCEI